MKRLTAATLSCLLFLFAKADTFIVTSNADSGPGTLREAITLAAENGTAIPDLIRFNLPQLAFNQRIINLVTELPSLTSNLTIDGTTQPGDAYTVTDAKICIKKNDYAPSFAMLRINNAQGVRIYGLYLYYGYWQGLFGNPYRSNLLYGIELRNCSNIEIGAEGRGNVINGVVHGVYSNSDSCRNVVIRSNYIGHGRYYDNSVDDIDETVLGVDGCITLAQVKNITIGGNRLGEGNVFGSPRRAINIDSKYSNGNGFIVMQNNIFGRQFDKKTLIRVYDFWDAYVTVGRSRNTPVDWSSDHLIDYRITFTDNDIPSHVRFSHISDSIVVQRNHFEEDQRSTTGPGAKLMIWRTSKGGLVGGEDESNANIFQKKINGNYFPSIRIEESGPFTVLKNVLDCNTVYGSTTSIWHYNNQVPFAQIDLQTSDSAVGRATPNTRVDLYYDDPCTACEGQRFIAHVKADAAGKWKYVAPLQGTVIATATSSIGYTSEFSKPLFRLDSMVVKQPTCGKKNGSIKNIKTEGAETYYWVRYHYPDVPDTVSHSLDLTNAGPGEYILHGVHGGTCVNIINQSLVLEDRTPKAETFWANVTQPSCGRFNGSVSGLAVSNGQYAATKWINSQGQTLSSDLSIGSLGPGTYRFVVTDTTFTGGCSDTATFILNNQSGPSLLVDNLLVKNAVCGQNGSITKLIFANAQGTPFIRWTDSLNNTVGTTLDLLNVPPGKYRLQFKDASGCDTIITPFYTVGNTGAIAIDTAGKRISPAKCSGGSGSIQGIKTSGGENYVWKNTTTGAVVGASPDVYNLSAATYQLTVGNNKGCSEASPTITVPQAFFQRIDVQDSRAAAATCDRQNGFVEIKHFSRDTALYAFRWVDSATGQTISSHTSLYNIGNGSYFLFAKDTNGCEQQIMNALLLDAPKPSFDYTRMQVTPDQCLTSSGAIQGILVNNISTGTTNYAWINTSGDTIGRASDIRNLPPGSYRLRVNNSGCMVESRPVTVGNSNVTLPNPQYDEQTILKNTTATLKVKNTQPGTYRLFADPLATTPLQQNSTGDFITPALVADKVFYVRFVKGVCQSDLVAITVKVVDKTAVYVPGAFTPNGDGKNDVLKAIAFGKIKLHYFTVYNRWGEVVFSTTDFSKGWNGTIKGQPAETGVFVWIVKAMDELTGKPIELKGTVTVIR